MNSYLHSGETAKVFFNNQPPKTFTIFCKADDEIVLIEPFKIHASLRKFPGNTVVISTFIKAPDGTKINVGDKLNLTTQSGKKFIMFVSYSFGKDGIVLSFKKVPSRSSIKWLLKLMSHI